MELLLLVIPFEDTGAMETFLLNAIANDSAYDAEIIRKGNQFVEEVDKERKYLTKRRYITKSKFDVYFSIRTAAEQFVERQNILKRVPWEQYSQIQEEFQKLKDFGIPGTIGDGDLWLFWCPWWHFIKIFLHVLYFFSFYSHNQYYFLYHVLVINISKPYVPLMLIRP